MKKSWKEASRVLLIKGQLSSDSSSLPEISPIISIDVVHGGSHRKKDQPGNLGVLIKSRSLSIREEERMVHSFMIRGS